MPVGGRGMVAAIVLSAALASAPSRASAQFVMDNNGFQRMLAIVCMSAGGAGLLATWLGFPFYVRDQHFEPCTAECSSEFGTGFVPLAGPWIVLSSSVMVPSEGSIGFGLAQIGSLALLGLGILLWGTSINPDTDQPEWFALSPMLVPGGGLLLAMAALE